MDVRFVVVVDDVSIAQFRSWCSAYSLFMDHAHKTPLHP